MPATELIVAAPLKPFTVTVNDVLVPTVPLRAGATAVVEVAVFTVGATVAVTVNVPVPIKPAILPVAVTGYVFAASAVGNVYDHVEPVTVAAPLTPFTLTLIAVLVPVVPVMVGICLSLKVMGVTIGTVVAFTTNSPTVVSTKLVLPVAITLYVPAGKMAGV